MALAWNAGWVNSPQGFKSPILRTHPRCDRAVIRPIAPRTTFWEATEPGMGRITATAIHLSLCVAAGVGFALFVIPRWWELMGETSHTLGTIIRIATGVSVALAALPVVLTLLRTRAPGAQTPAPALTLRMWSAGAHVVAGALIIATAIAEIWVSLDAAGPWLYGVYGGALTVVLLGAAAFYLAFVAEKPPALPKAAKPKKTRRSAVRPSRTPRTRFLPPRPTIRRTRPRTPTPRPRPRPAPKSKPSTRLTRTPPRTPKPTIRRAPKRLMHPRDEAQGTLRNKRPSVNPATACVAAPAPVRQPTPGKAPSSLPERGATAVADGRTFRPPGTFGDG